MRKLVLLTIMMIGFAVSAQAKYYIGVVTTNLNLREGPSTEYDVICRISKGEYVFIDTDETENGFYYVVYVNRDEIGYVSRKYVTIIEEVKVDNKGVLEVVGELLTYNSSEVVITNSSSYKCTIRIGGNNYKFNPKETRSITVNPGTYNIQASAPGVIPYIGSEKLVGGYIYNWTFYVYISHGFKH